MIIGGTLLIGGGGVVLAAPFRPDFAQTMHLTALHHTLLGRVALIGSLAGGTIILAVGLIVFTTGRPTSKHVNISQPSQAPHPLPMIHCSLVPLPLRSESRGQVNPVVTGILGSRLPTPGDPVDKLDRVLSIDEALKTPLQLRVSEEFRPRGEKLKPKVLFEGYRENIETQEQGIEFLISSISYAFLQIEADTALKSLIQDVYKALIPQANGVFWQKAQEKGLVTAAEQFFPHS